MQSAACVSDYRALAKARLPHFLFEYLDGGSYGEVTLRRNVDEHTFGGDEMLEITISVGVAHARGDVRAHDLRGLLEADGLVLLADGGLGRRREQRLRKLRRLPQARG